MLMGRPDRIHLATQRMSSATTRFSCCTDSEHLVFRYSYRSGNADPARERRAPVSPQCHYAVSSRMSEM